MKCWEQMTMAERQERLGDPTIDRSVQTQDMDAECVRRLLRGEPMSRDMKRRARAAIQAAAQ
jgi:hypothetical protein